MAKTSNVTMPLMSKALFTKDAFEFAIHNGMKIISPAFTMEGSIEFYFQIFNKIRPKKIYLKPKDARIITGNLIRSFPTYVLQYYSPD